MTPQGAATQAGFSAVMVSDQFDRLHHGLTLAAAAAAVNRPVVLFLSMAACCVVLTEAPASETGENPAGTVAGMPGWAALRPSPPYDSAREQNTAFRQRGLAGMDTLLESCAALGVRFLVCEAGLRAVGAPPTAIRLDLGCTITGAVGWLDATPAGAVTMMV